MRTRWNRHGLGCVCVLWWCALLALWPGRVLAAEYGFGAAPAWVVPVDPLPEPKAPGEARRGLRALLSDEQVRVEARGLTRYRHYASMAVDSSALGEVAGVSMSFDPSYQRITLHRLNIIRAGQVLDRLRTASIQVLRRETDLEQRIYDGSKTLSVVLDDVRVGDVVEYAYSLIGSNPVFDDMAAGAFELQWGVPVERVFVRLSAPLSRPLTVAARNTNVQPTVSQADGYQIRQWELRPAPALRVERDTPDGHDPYAYLQWSEYPSWQAVARWAQPLFAVPADPGPEVRREIEAIRASSAAPKERALAVLRFVQREIRYLGIEIGQGSHAPSPPALVLRRRFGDCKDKTLLAVTMLRALGIEARPALVNTSMVGAVAAWLPSPHAFNHVLVLAEIDGARYWIDPTRAPQKGDLDHLYQPDYGVALVVDQATRELVKMAPNRTAHTLVRAHFDLSDGLEKRVRYTVTTTARGIAAERLRAQLAADGAEELQATYLEFYARRYPGITVAAPLKVADDEVRNVVTVTETYTIARFWQPNKEDRRLYARFRSADLGARLDPPESTRRAAPLKLRYPEVVEEVTEVKLPVAFYLAEYDTRVDDPAFAFTHRAQALDGGMGLRLATRYEARAGQVAPAALEAYAANLETAQDAVGYRISRLPENSPRRETRRELVKTILATLAVVTLAAGVAVWMQSSRPHRASNVLVVLALAGALAVLAIALHLARTHSAMLGLLMLTFFLLMRALVELSRRAPPSHALAGLTQPEAFAAAGGARSALLSVLGYLYNVSVAAFGLFLIWKGTAWLMKSGYLPG